MAILSSCEKPTTPPPQPVAVMVTEAVVKDVPVQFKTFASVIPYQMVAVKAMVSSQLVKVNVKDGQYVKAGDLLFELDKQPFEATLRQAEANVRQVEANLTKDQAQSKFAQSEEKRQGELLKEKISAQSDYDQAKATADALLAATKADEAAVKADEAAIENAKVQLAYCTIKAPIDGRVGAVMITLGNLIKANDTAALLTINQVKPIYVSFFVPEGRLLDIKKYQTAEGLPVEAIIPADPTHPEHGHLTFINNQVDSTTGMIELRATFDNAGERLWPGLYVNVVVSLTTLPQVVVLPNRGVQTGQTTKYVFVVKADDTAEMRPVITGLITDTVTEITSGLKAGERVVTDGQLRLKDGSQVVVQAPGAGNTASGASATAASGRESRAGEQEKVETATTTKTAAAASARKAEAAKGGAGQ